MYTYFYGLFSVYYIPSFLNLKHRHFNNNIIFFKDKFPILVSILPTFDRCGALFFKTVQYFTRQNKNN